MAYPIFFLIGLVFDVIILAASGALIYNSIQPDFLGRCYEQLRIFADDPNGKIDLLIIGIVFLLFSLRGIFLLIFGRKGHGLIVSSTAQGTVSVSHVSIEHILRRLVEASRQGVRLRDAGAVSAGPGALNVKIKVLLDLVEINVTEYSKELEAVVRAHFKDKLGLEVKSFKLIAEYAQPES